MRNSFSRPQVSRSRSANSINRCHNLSVVAGCRATIFQPHSSADGGQAMTAGVPSAIATTNRRVRGLTQSSHSLHQSSPELLQPLRGFMQRFLGLPQSLPHAFQSSKEAHQPLQDAENKRIEIQLLKNGVLQPLDFTHHLTPALSPGGEGESFTALNRKPATELAGRSSANQKSSNRCSLSRRMGEGKGEGNSFSKLPNSQPSTNN